MDNSKTDLFRGKTVSVIGAARSGLATALALQRLGARVILSDSQSADRLDRERMREIEAARIPWFGGATAEQAIPEGVELVITSPGVPRCAPVLRLAVERKIPVWSEIEFAYRLSDAPMIAITGTNGKTTTTLLTAAMLRQAGMVAEVAGNISADEIKRTLVEAALDGGKPHRVIVAEISSFQLEWVEQFAPRVAVLTNISADHLNRHSSMEEYVATKARIFAAQNARDWAVLNYDDPWARKIGSGALSGRVCWFTRDSAPPWEGPAAWIQNGSLVVRAEKGAEPVEIMQTREFPPTLPGTHSVENALAASIAALALGASSTAIAGAIREFAGVAHRMEIVADIRGVRYINNSMCTNVQAAIRSLQAMDRPTLVIAGGADKALDFAPLASVMKSCAKGVILIGTAADKMEHAFRSGGCDQIRRAPTLAEAILLASREAAPGDAVLLSPACASFDMFRDFEERGDAFRNTVRSLAGGAE